MKNLFSSVSHYLSKERQNNKATPHQELESLGLALRLGEIHAVISNSPTEITGLWDTLCMYQENSQLGPQLFGDFDFSKYAVKPEVFLLTNLFPTLSVFENIFMFETSLYNQRRFLLKAQFKKCSKNIIFLESPILCLKILSQSRIFCSPFFGFMYTSPLLSLYLRAWIDSLSLAMPILWNASSIILNQMAPALFFSPPFMSWPCSIPTGFPLSEIGIL